MNVTPLHNPSAPQARSFFRLDPSRSLRIYDLLVAAGWVTAAPGPGGKLGAGAGGSGQLRLLAAGGEGEGEGAGGAWRRSRAAAEAGQVTSQLYRCMVKTQAGAYS